MIIGIYRNSGFKDNSKPPFYFLHKIDGPSWFTKPLIECLPCMASLHSVYVYWLFYGFTWSNLAHYPVYVVALSGLNIILNKLIGESNTTS